MADLSELMERVEKASGELSDADAVELWALGADCKIVSVKNWSRDDYGYRVVSLLVDSLGSRRAVHVPEWQIPDRSVDAALALVERMLPGAYTLRLSVDPSGNGASITWWPEGLTGGVRLQAEDASVSLPLAILTALLRTLSTRSPK